jgi:two-component system nitrogen regulation response regulator NtrX
MKQKILIVDDEISILQSLNGILADEGYAVVQASSGEEGLEKAGKDQPDLILLDIWMPGVDGMTVLDEVKRLYPLLPVIIISGHGTIETAVKATRMGAFDFIEKPLSIERVLVSIQNAIEFSRLEEENRLLRKKSNRSIIGQSAAVCALREQIGRAAPTNATVLITGENGTGKELAARMIHLLSRRSTRPMIEVNCAAIPEDLIESELFGHEKGAFTGAIEKRKGKFDSANGGTLFLDEIGDMSHRTQAKILRIIQEQVFERVGGSHPVEVDVRIVAATNKDLQREIELGRFRQDLYYRLNVIPIFVPPLRERADDIPLLIEHFADEIAGESALGKKKIDPRIYEVLHSYSWPGNIRELRNFIERLMIMTPGNRIGPDNLPADLRNLPRRETDQTDYLQYPSLKEARSCFERDYLQRKLEENGWNVSVTASAIGLERAYLHHKIKALGIKRTANGETAKAEG